MPQKCARKKKGFVRWENVDLRKMLYFKFGFGLLVFLEDICHESFKTPYFLRWTRVCFHIGLHIDQDSSPFWYWSTGWLKTGDGLRQQAGDPHFTGPRGIRLEGCCWSTGWHKTVQSLCL